MEPPSNQEEDLKKITDVVKGMREDLDNLYDALEELKPAQQEIIRLLKEIEKKG